MTLPLAPTLPLALTLALNLTLTRTLALILTLSNPTPRFDSLKFGRAVYQDPDKPSVDGAPISPHHSHFLFIDAGRERREAWGSEIVVRAEIEQHMMQSRAVPMVLLVVQGGPGTLATVLANAQLGCPVVLLSNSGGAASA